MRLEYVRSFIEVVKHKSFSLAAKQLYLSQPTTSIHIKQLESELGVQLVKRSTKELLLTEEGRVFYPYALQLIETEQMARKHLGTTGNGVDGVASIAVSSVLGCDQFLDFLSEYRKKYTDISFQTVVCVCGEVVKKILEYEVQIGISGVEYTNDNIHAEVLFEDEIILITPNKEKYIEMKGVFPIEELKNEWFINQKPGSATLDMVRYVGQILKLNPASFKIAAQFENIEMVKRAVSEGAGVAFISKYVANDLLKKQNVLEFAFPDYNMKRRFYLMCHKERKLLPIVDNVMQSLREYYSKKRYHS